MTSTRALVARWLEGVGPRSRALEILSRGWETASARRVARPLSFPADLRVIGVGGPTLGGSYKTPFAIALATALAERGERVAFVGHAYRARPRRARIVSPMDDVREVGDEALLAARTLDVEVVVGPTRQAALDVAARHATCIVLDGVLQARPSKFACSLLTIDEDLPWGSGKCPPAGDLKAPREALLAAADAVVSVGEGVFPQAAKGAFPHGAEGAALPPTFARSHLDGARDPEGARASLSDLRSTCFGLLVAIARPDRVIRSLARRGLHAAATIELGDHDQPAIFQLERAAARKQRVKLWLTTPKCALKLPPKVAGSPVFVLDHRIELPKTLVDWVLSKGAGAGGFCPLGS
jgi:tetraacyldisaccharide 4'-kinase